MLHFSKLCLFKYLYPKKFLTKIFLLSPNIMHFRFVLWAKIESIFLTKMMLWPHVDYIRKHCVKMARDGLDAIFSISGSLFSLKYLESFPFWKAWALAAAAASKIYFSDSLDPPSVFCEIPAISQSKICDTPS